MRAFVEIVALGKTFATPAGPAEIVRDFSLYVSRGEFVCLLGHSGCGKTTVLSILMGLATPTTGGVVIDGNPIAVVGTGSLALVLASMVWFSMTLHSTAVAITDWLRER